MAKILWWTAALFALVVFGDYLEASETGHWNMVETLGNAAALSSLVFVPGVLWMLVRKRGRS